MATGSPLEQATQQLARVRADPDGHIDTDAFLGVCRLVLPVVDKLGTAFMLVRSDVSGNIQRLADRCANDPVRYARLFTIVQDEVEAGTAGGASSCTKGLLWLKRAMEFMLRLVQATLEQPDLPLDKVVYNTYSDTLMRFHGFIVSSTFTVAFKFVPGRQQFVESIGSGGSQSVQQQMQHFVAAFQPVLQEIHEFFVANNLDDPAKESRAKAQGARAEELREEQGAPVTLNLLLPDGSTAQLSQPAGVTVAYLKLLIEQQHGLPMATQELLLGGRILMDPFSLCDIPGVSPGSEASVTVKTKG